MLIWGKLGLSKLESGTFWASQILKVVSNPESGTFWASVSGQIRLIWGKPGLSNPESGTFWASQILKVVHFELL